MSCYFLLGAKRINVKIFEIMSNHLLGKAEGKVFRSQQKVNRIYTVLRAEAAES